MTCEQFREMLMYTDALSSTFEQREFLKEHIDGCQHCQEWIATEIQDGSITVAEVEIADKIRREDEKMTKHPMSKRQKQKYGDS